MSLLIFLSYEKPVTSNEFISLFVLETQIASPLQNDPNIQTMKMACYTCPMFEICNGCKKTVRDMKREGTVESHCKQMKGMAPRILELNGMDPRGVTPYVDESIDQPDLLLQL